MKSWLIQIADVWRLLRQLRPYLGAGRGLLAATLASSLVMVVFEGVGVGLLVPLLSLLLGGNNAVPMRPIQWLQTLFPSHSPAFYIGVYCVAIVVAIAAKNLASFVASLFSARLKRRVGTSLRAALFDAMQRASLDVFDQRPGGEVANIFLVESYRTTIAIEVAIGFVQRGGIALFYVAALFYISWQLTWLVVGLGLAIGGSLAFIYRRLGRAGTRLTDLNHQLSTALEQSFAGVRVVRATNAQREERERFHRINAAQAASDEETTRAHALLFPLVETLAVIGAMAIVVCAYIFFVRPGHMLSSYLLWYLFVLLRLLPLLNTLYGIQGNLFYVAGGIREVDRFLSMPAYPERPFGTQPFPGLRSGIRLEGLGYTYSTGTRALDDVTFEVRAGQTVAIVGSSGSGKSTLASLLLRLRAPTDGRITVDGTDYWQFSAESWHRAIALVEQDAFLFHGSLRENVLYGWQDVTQGALEQAIAAANLSDMVASLPNGLETLVGERGAMVSGGQRQRIAIARAIVRNPGILVLDEATSHLDSVSEQLVQQALSNAARGRTTIVIAHRLSTIRDADWIIVFEHGRIVEQGTWTSLQSAKGTFDRLVHGLTA
ncbi:MAG TPA: ABC transporter ATP-binding protein [Vicinamibacterales bacterium]|nr:ABC transporter ATP-binding protein [Vicinamibacterales bacterium]